MIYFLPHWAIGTGGRWAAPPPKWKERRKKRRAQPEDGRVAREIKGGVQPCLWPSFPCRLHRISLQYRCKGPSWSSSGVPVCSSLSFDLLPFSGACRGWRLISVTVTMAFLICTTAFNTCTWSYRRLVTPNFRVSEFPAQLYFSYASGSSTESTNGEDLSTSRLPLPGAHTQLQITETSRTNGLHIEICRSDSDRPSCTISPSCPWPGFSPSQPASKQASETRAGCRSIKKGARKRGSVLAPGTRCIWMGRMHWRCMRMRRDATWFAGACLLACTNQVNFPEP